MLSIYTEDPRRDFGNDFPQEWTSNQLTFKYFEPQAGTWFVVAETQMSVVWVLSFKLDEVSNLPHHIIHIEKPYRRSWVGETLMWMYFQNDPYKLWFGVYIRTWNAKSIAFHEKLWYRRVREAEKWILYFMRS
jgi:ribosomal protein S18 acetylase RimI-like enzyme